MDVAEPTMIPPTQVDDAKIAIAEIDNPIAPPNQLEQPPPTAVTAEPPTDAEDAPRRPRRNVPRANYKDALILGLDTPWKQKQVRFNV